MKAIEAFEKLLQESIDDGAFPGANYCIVTKNRSYFGSLGNRALFPEIEKNDIDTVYDMASLSKVVSTTSLILKLVEAGRLRLHTAVQTFIPEFRHQEVTVWDLLTHSSGLPADVSRAKEIASKEELMEKIFAMDLVYPRNSQIVYSDIGYILLGKIIEKITGVPLDRYAKEILFTPLEMFDTTYNPGDKKRCAPTEERKDRIVQGILRGEVHDEKSYILGGVAGHAGLFSTVTDVAHFIDMILNKGVYKGRRIFSEAVIDLLFAPKVEISHPLIKNYDRRGIGWIIQSCYSSAGDLVSEETILHTGFTGTNIWIDRRNEIGFCLLTNRVHPTRENLKIITVRPKLANFIMAHLDEFKKEDL